MEASHNGTGEALDGTDQALNKAAVRLADLAVECAEGCMVDSEVSWADAADILSKCSKIVSEQRFGPQGGDVEYNYRTWQGYRRPGFVG